MADADEFKEWLRRDGWLRDPQAQLLPLRGGVSSEIYLVVDGDERFVVKRALPKLKVRDDWFADPRRNVSEWNYFKCVSQFLPDAVPQLRFANPSAGYFGMDYLGGHFANWKQMLLRGAGEIQSAQIAGRILGTIHRATANRPELRQRFDTLENFRQLRLAPYLLTTGERHPDLREFYEAEATRLAAAKECLVHGDFSPKNLLVCGARMVLLDAEVAWYGDAAFDVAFLLNHLFLKALYHAPRDPGIAEMIQMFWRTYRAERSSTSRDLEITVTRLLTLLLLARVDGKSPVEYLDSTRVAFIRNFVPSALAAQLPTVNALSELWFDLLKILPPLTAKT